MKYFDRNTVKTTSNWQNKQSANDFKKIDTQTKNRFKKAVKEFSYKISDKLWWNSLDFNTQSKVYNEYMDWNSTWYSYTSEYGHNILVGSALAEKLASITEEDHNERIEFLMSKYSNPSKRRDLVIREILNFE